MNSKNGLKMKLTQQQFDALTPYEENFRTMVRSKWSRNPGSAALDLIHAIYVQVTGNTQRLNKGCQHCIMRLLTDMGTIYLADLEERKRSEMERKPERKVDVTETETINTVKVEVKTEIKKRGGRKPKSKE